MEMDYEYRNRISKAILDAIVKTSMSEDGSVSLMRSGEIVDACVITIVAFIASLSDTQSPTGRRNAVDQIRKKMLRRLVIFQEDVAKHGMPKNFSVVTEKDFH